MIQLLPVFCSVYWLGLASFFDLETGEVPDLILYTGLGTSILTGLGAAVFSRNPEINVSFTILIGLGALIYGWAVYWFGGWGGADAVALGTTGFGVSQSILQSPAATALGIAILFAATTFFYVCSFVLYHFYSHVSVRNHFKRLLSENPFRVVASSAFAGGLGTIVGGYETGILLSVLPSGFLAAFAVEKSGLQKWKKTEHVQPGEIVDFPDKPTKIKGVTAGEIENIDKERVKVISGIKFLPVFPISLALYYVTDLHSYLAGIII